MPHYFGGNPGEEPEVVAKRQLPNVTVTPSGVRAEKIDAKPVVTGESSSSITMQNQAPGWKGQPTEFKKNVNLGGFVKNNPVDPTSGEHYELSAEAKSEAGKASDFTNEPANASQAVSEAAKGLRSGLPEAVAKQGRMKR